MVRKSQAAHGVSVVEIERVPRRRSGRRSGHRRNRRITANTPMPFSGPAAGHRLRPHPGRPGGTLAARHAQQLRQRLHPVGHLPDLRGELQRLLPRRRRAARPRARSADQPVRRRRRPQQLGRPTTTASSSRRGPQRAQPVRLGRRDRPVRPGLARRSSAPRWAGSSTRAPPCTSPRDGRVVVYMGDDQVNEHVYKFVSARQLAVRARPRAEPARRGHALRRQVQRRRHRRVAAAGPRQHGADRRERVRRPGRRAGQDPARRQRRRGHPDGPPRVDHGATRTPAWST